MWDLLKTNCSANVNRNEETCQLVQWVGALMCFSSFWTTEEVRARDKLAIICTSYTSNTW